MNIKLRGTEKVIKKFQEGGAMPAEGTPVEQTPEGGAPVEGGGEDPLMQLASVFQQGLQNQDCQMLAQGAQMFLQLISQANQEQQPASEPIYKKGGVLLRRERI